LKATSTNVANVNTDGYARLDVQFTSTRFDGRTGRSRSTSTVSPTLTALAGPRCAAHPTSPQLTWPGAVPWIGAQGLLGDLSDSLGPGPGRSDPGLLQLPVRWPSDPASAAAPIGLAVGSWTLLSAARHHIGRKSPLRE